jgi:hypothetical protein
MKEPGLELSVSILRKNIICLDFSVDKTVKYQMLFNYTTQLHSSRLYKLARQIEKYIDSHNKMLKYVVKSNSQYSFPSRQFKSREDNHLSSSTLPTRTTDQPVAKQLTLEQKKTLGLCFICGEIFFLAINVKLKACIY